jgi:flagellar biosynthesis chaperone FliJ
MIGLNFKNFKHFSIRSYINTLCRINSKEEFKELFEIFHSINEKKSPLQNLKILIFYHLMIQEVPSMCEDLLMPEIHKLQEQIQTNENFFKERRTSGSIEKNLSHSVEKTVDWLKNKISKPK